MVTMTAEPIGIYTITDLERERERDRDDRLRWELLDGELVVTPSPLTIHQAIVGELHLRLAPGTPEGTHLFMAPLDVRLDERNVLQPDLVLVDEASIETESIVGAPLLAIEVLSPSTEGIDRREKLRAYRTLPGLKEYAMVSQDECRVELHRRAVGLVGTDRVGPSSGPARLAPDS